MFEKVKIRYQAKDKNQGNFIIEPLPQGYGMTIGNSLRRVLLSSLPGAAITSVKIHGAAHEFTSLKGVKEDMVQFLLNLKRVRVKFDGEKDKITLKLDATGPGKVTAHDIESPSGVKIANPDLHLATLSDKRSKLEAEMTVEAGTGYMPVEDRKASGIGAIPLDAMFSPVVRVNYTIEATRVGQFTNFDKLTMEVMTDGTIDPETAVREAAKILVGGFELMVEPAKVGEEEEVEAPRAAPNKIDTAATIEELELPTRVNNALHAAGIETIGELLETPSDKLATIKNLGSKSIKDIQAKIAEKGLMTQDA
jgi:DNA-directed RNA polymerase subunit alpha